MGLGREASGCNRRLIHVSVVFIRLMSTTLRLRAILPAVRSYRNSGRTVHPSLCDIQVMINKISSSIADALNGIADGSTVLIGGFGTAGIPSELIEGLIEQGARELTVVNNNAGNGDSGLAALLKAGRVRKIICSFPRQADSHVFDTLYRSGKIELELVPQGNLAERLRAAGAGVGAFFTPTGYGTELALNAHGSPKEARRIDGKDYVLEYPIHGDVALIKAEEGDRWGQPHLPQGCAQLRPCDGDRRQMHHRHRSRNR